jgi:hypothetical protein
MQPSDDQLTDAQLDAMLREWQAPTPPARIRAAVFGKRRTAWWGRSIRLPLPVAACLALLFGAALWRAVAPRPPAAPQVRAVTFEELRPVTDFQPRIIRRGHAQN